MVDLTGNAPPELLKPVPQSYEPLNPDEVPEHFCLPSPSILTSPSILKLNFVRVLIVFDRKLIWFIYALDWKGV